MRRKFIPFYLSRAALSAIFAALVLGLTWSAVLLAIGIFGLFLLYLHSGWFRVDASHPLTPIRRDERARQIQRKALIAAVAIGLLIYGVLTQAIGLLDLSLIAGPVALSLGVIAYFVTQFVLLART